MPTKKPTVKIDISPLKKSLKSGSTSAKNPAVELTSTSTVEDTLNERGTRYGDFTFHARIAQDLQDVMRNAKTGGFGSAQGLQGVYNGWELLDAPKRQALTVIADKLARILSGDPAYADNWHDIQGYAKLVEDRL